MADVKHLPATATADQISAEMEENGTVIIDEFLPRDVLDRFNGEIEPSLDMRGPADPCMNDAVALFHGSETRQLSGIAGLSHTFVDHILLHPTYKAVGDHFLLRNCASYLLNIANVLDRGPGSGSQFLHRDQEVWPRQIGAAFQHRMFASLIALGEYTADMGATRVVPGSHKWPLDREARPEDVVAADMEPGSAILYLGSVLHAGGANTTSKRRRGMHISFCLGFLRTEENIVLSTPVARMREMPRRAQELLGFGIYDGQAFGEGFLGMLDNRNPLDVIAPENA